MLILLLLLNFVNYLRSDQLGSKYNITDTGQEIPPNFDAREQWPECKSIGEIVNQKSCNNFWAVVYCGILSDRFCIASKGGMKDFRASVDDITICCVDCVVRNATHIPCGKYSFPADIINYMAKSGVVSGGDTDSGIGCKPYSEALKTNDPDSCRRECSNANYKTPYKEDRVFVTGGALEQPINIRRVQIEIMTHGPIFAGLFKSQEFQHAYNNKESPFKGVFAGNSTVGAANHAVRVIGWGSEEGVSYWLAANSRGDDWGGLKGFLKVKMGGNVLGIESNMVALYPKYDPKKATGSGGVLKSSLGVVLGALGLMYLLN